MSSNDAKSETTTAFRTGFGPSGFSERHIGPNAEEMKEMLAFLGKKSLKDLIDAVVPTTVRSTKPLSLSRFPQALSEYEALERIKAVASKNVIARSEEHTSELQSH